MKELTPKRIFFDLILKMKYTINYNSQRTFKKKFPDGTPRKDNMVFKSMLFLVLFFVCVYACDLSVINYVTSFLFL